MPDRALALEPRNPLRVAYRPLVASEALAPNVLAALTFGESMAQADPRFVRVGLAPLNGADVMELWYGNGIVNTGVTDGVRHASDADHLFGVLEFEEHEHGGIPGAAQAAYSTLRTFLSHSTHPHLLRVWNYFDAINRGVGDEERYKQFCIGRAAGLGNWPAEAYPAATVIGRRDGRPMLQVFWLSSSKRGAPVDNPRQTRPHRYPRQYGPRAPQFSRAMLVDDRLVLISGTASIVGHASHHPDDLASQLDEVLNNLDSVLQKSADSVSGLSSQLGPRSLLKIYLRDPGDAPQLEDLLRARLPAGTQYLLLAGEVCRSDLLVEAEAVHFR